MNSSIDDTIATAILRYLAAQIGAGPTARAFFRLEGFSIATYHNLLAQLAAQGNHVAERPLVVRSIEPIEEYSNVAMELDRSATWYRNHLPAGQSLLLILNRRTSDAQSLKDVFAVSEQTLTRDGIGVLIEASFSSYQLNNEQQRTLITFVRRLRRLRIEPQLRDLAEFLRAVDATMHQHPGSSLAEAIVYALPAINLFRCRELAPQLNTPRGDKLLRALKQAAQIGVEVLEPRTRQTYLDLLDKTVLADDTAFAGMSATAKADLLRRFIDGQLGDTHDDLFQVLQIDWNEVQQIISPRGRTTKSERYADLAEQLRTRTEATAFATNNDLIDVINSLQHGREPDEESIDRLTIEHGGVLGKTIHNALRRMVRPRTRRTADFLIGLAAIAVDLLHPRQELLAPGTNLRVTLASTVQEHAGSLHEAATVFQAIYGGLEHMFPAIQWHLAPLWNIASAPDTADDETDEDGRERVTRDELAFRVAVINAAEEEQATAELIWQYRSDSPAAATAQALAAEGAALASAKQHQHGADAAPTLRVPIYNNSQPLNEIGDLDLRYPLASLGAWYERPTDVRTVLTSALKPAARALNWGAVEAALAALEHAWAVFIEAARAGLLGTDSGPLIQAYQTLLDTALHSLHTGNEVGASYRILNQAWVIGPSNFSTWAIVPLLHPLKLLALRERSRYFNRLIAQLLDPAVPVSIVDVKRFQQELAATYGSSNFPPVLALPRSTGRPAERFLPIEEAEGYELYFHEAASAEAFGLDTDLLAEDENELAAFRAVEGIVAVVQDYIETYPFVRDGIEILLFECRNGALPGMLVDQLTRASERRGWTVRLNIIVHTSQRGAPLFRRVSTWVAGGHPQTERPRQAYFPPITVKVLECALEELFSQRDDTDIVVLADVLAERGQQVRSDLERLENQDVPAEGYLPTYRASQEPFQHGEQQRRILLSPPQQPTIVRLFLLAQHAALERRAPPPNQEARFYRDLSLEEWAFEIERLHKRFNWVICYDTSIDRFLLEATFPEQVQVIRYSLGLGAKRQHNLTVSSSGRSQGIVVRRLAARLGQMFPQAPAAFRDDVAGRLVSEAKHVSGDIVLRAAGPGAFLNELIGLVAAKFETEQRYQAAHAGMLTTWILLDDFEHWFGGGKFPDLLYIAIGQGAAGDLALHMHILEAKCVGELSFDTEAIDAEEQVRRGVSRLAQAFAPGNSHLDALYWYDQLYRAIAGNLAVEPEQHELWELFRDQLHTGAFSLDLSGHTWVFCYDGQADVAAGPSERPFFALKSDAAAVPLYAHHYGRNELARLLSALIHARGGPVAPPEVWVQPAPPAASLVEAQPKQPIALSAGQAREEPPASKPLPIVPATADRSTHEAVPAPVVAPDPEQHWLVDKARELERVLRQRGVQVLPIDAAQADVGPSIVRFKVRLRPQESLRKMQSVADDLARDLALASTPLIDNVLRTNFVGVDIPRERAQMIELRPLLDTLGTPGPAELPIIIGVTPDGSLIVEDLSEFPHLLVAGATNSGKSVFLRSMLLSLMTQYPSGKLELLIVDPKRTDFTFFNNVPYLRGGKVLIEHNEAREALLELVRGEMPRRQNLIANRSTKIKLFNQRYPDEALPPIVALIDEYALLLSTMGKKDREAFEQDLMILAAAARSVGIHLVLATQRPSADVVTSTLKANLDTRIAFRVASNMNSRVVLDAPGAENLLGRGDMLFRRPSGETVRLQAPFMDEERMQASLAALGTSR